jgi:hypothetical protein
MFEKLNLWNKCKHTKQGRQSSEWGLCYETIIVAEYEKGLRAFQIPIQNINISSLECEHLSNWNLILTLTLKEEP